MRYVGSRLKALLNQERGRYTELAKSMCKYRRARKNESNKDYNLIPLLSDGHNVTLSTLTGLMRETGKSIEFFVDFEPGELLQSHHEIGNHNIEYTLVNPVRIISDAFNGVDSIISINIPHSIKSISENAFANCPNLESIICNPTIPPLVGENAIDVTSDSKIFVPRKSLEKYKVAEGWIKYANRIYPIE